jgi:hypothetical protein
VLKGNVEEELRGWAKNWLDRFKPFTNFLFSLSRPLKPEAEEYYARLFGDAIIEALLSDKTLDCKLIAKFSEYGYVRCGDLYVQTRSNAKEFIGNKSQFKEFTKDVAGRLEASYRYLVNLSVWGGEVIGASNLSKSMKGATIVGVHVWSYPQVRFWSHVLTILFRTPHNTGGDLTFALNESGVMDVYGTDALERKDMRSEAEQDVLDHTPELDKALEGLYFILRIGFRGIVGYVLY